MPFPFPVHPRVRGEHLPIGRKIVTSCGSSPRARGTHVPAPSRCRGDRFIPACAGNTASPEPVTVLAMVHPRVRGEHISTLRENQTHDGSSPRARGTRSPGPTFSSRRRFIPACAGNTGRRWNSTPNWTVHPRVRGEHNSELRLSDGTNGSSPRARGTRLSRRRRRSRHRFIPACAGNTAAPLRCRRPSPVHPRVRGEHYGYSMARYAVAGSSPRARGTLFA